MDYPPQGYLMYWECDDSHYAIYHWASSTIRDWLREDYIEPMETPNPDQFYVSDWRDFSNWCHKMKNDKRKLNN